MYTMSKDTGVHRAINEPSKLDKIIASSRNEFIKKYRTTTIHNKAIPRSDRGVKRSGVVKGEQIT